MKKSIMWMVVTLSISLIVQGKEAPAPTDEAFTPIEVGDEGPPQPYSFEWSASRFHKGKADREHKEERGEDGITRGVFRYVDPRQQVQEVSYTADADGFHVEASNLPQETKAMQKAREKHLQEFQRISEEHAQTRLLHAATAKDEQKAAGNEEVSTLDEGASPDVLQPYSFEWSASRFHKGKADREHKEERGEDGITRGVFRYVDPRQQVQEVSYTADADGFHVEASNLPQETKAVQKAREKHLQEFQRISEERAQLIAEREAAEKAAEKTVAADAEVNRK